MHLILVAGQQGNSSAVHRMRAGQAGASRRSYGPHPQPCGARLTAAPMTQGNELAAKAHAHHLLLRLPAAL